MKPNNRPKVITFKKLQAEQKGLSFLLLFSLFCSLLSNAQCKKVFQFSFGGSGSDVAYDIADAGNNQFYVVGTTDSYGAGGTDIMVVKTDMNGKVIWSKVFGEGGDESVRRIKKTSDGGVLITGQTKSFSNANGDMLCLKVNADGSLAWSRKFGVGSPNGDLGMDIMETSDGGYAVSGILNVQGKVADLILIRLNNSANIVWSKKYDSNEGENGVGILQTGDTLVVSGDVDNNTSSFNGIIMKFNINDGSYYTGKKIVPAQRDLFNSYIFKYNGNGFWISAHMIDGNSYAQMQQTILKLDNNLNITKSYKLNVNGAYTNGPITGFIPLSTGFVTCASPQTNASGYIYQVNSDGSIKFAKKISGSADRTFYRVEHIGKKLIAIGKDNTTGDNNFLISALDEDGSLNAACNSDTALLGISNPAFTTSDFTWNSIGNPNFINTNITLSNSVVNIERNDLCFVDTCVDTTGCGEWLHVKDFNGGVRIGDLDITGNKLTVEATFNRTVSYSGSELYAGDIVSKHLDFSDANYLLRPNTAEITTTNGYFRTPDICDIELNKSYHVAMVYDGNSLKFYRNGFLMSSVAASGNLFQNDWITTIGDLAYQPGFNNETFIGYIDEVRIWNVDRSQAEIRQYMNQSLPNPSSQTGLLAYYTFEDLKNKQGNSAWNGAATGNASIQNGNPVCSFVTDSCGIVQTQDSIVINDYTEVLSENRCTNGLTVSDASKFKIGDTVLLIQMKGAIVDSSNTSNFGTVSSYENAGNYEFNYIQSITGTTIQLKNQLSKSYSIPAGRVQLIRVPYYNDFVVSSKLTCLPWDGKTGGVLVFNVKNKLELNADIDVTGKGFIGARPIQNSNYICNVDSFIITNDDGSLAARKGEGIFETSGYLSGRGKIANGGGGGNSTNAGGGGGSNGGKGGNGGKQYVGHVCDDDFSNGGIGGEKLVYDNISNKIFLGGGGGAGHENESLTSQGGNGGGIVIITTNALKSNSFSIKSDGTTPVNIQAANEDGKSGGGAGGTILLNYSALSDKSNIEAKGGDGDFSNASLTVNKHGPGGGGGGGVVWINKSSYENNLTTDINGGINGTNVNINNDPWGATSGTSGQLLTGLILPLDTEQFKKNIDSLKIKDTLTSCNEIYFNGIAYTNSLPITSWHWSFGDGKSSDSQNISHIYVINDTNSHNYNVKLKVTDTYGCLDSVTTTVKVSSVKVDAGLDTAICKNASIILNGSGGSIYQWSPSKFLNDSSLQNPSAFPDTTTTFYVTVTTNNCSATDSITINVHSLPSVSTLNDTSLCNGTSIQLTTSSNGNTFSWTPSKDLSDPNTDNPIASPTNTTQYIVTATSVDGCFSKDSVTINVLASPSVTASADTLICVGRSVVLSATSLNAVQYVWSPATTLDNNAVPNPTATPKSSTNYHVEVTDVNGCKAKDSLMVNIKQKPVFTIDPLSAGICVGESVVLTASGGDTYQWSPANTVQSPNSASTAVFPTDTTTYQVLITDNVCDTSNSLFATVVLTSLPNISVSKSNDADCVLGEAKLTASGGVKYVWTPASSLSNPNIANPFATPDTTTTYHVKISNANGCTGEESIEVKVIKGEAANGYLMPSAFTPDNDGNNDCFGVRKWGYVTNLDFSVYNRWGNKVFHSTNSDNCWDGTYRGTRQPAGVYVYQIRAKTICGNVYRKGTVVLIR